MLRKWLIAVAVVVGTCVAGPEVASAQEKVTKIGKFELVRPNHRSALAELKRAHQVRINAARSEAILFSRTVVRAEAAPSALAARTR